MVELGLSLNVLSFNRGQHGPFFTGAIRQAPLGLMGIEGDVDSCLYEIAGSHIPFHFVTS